MTKRPIRFAWLRHQMALSTTPHSPYIDSFIAEPGTIVIVEPLEDGWLRMRPYEKKSVVSWARPDYYNGSVFVPLSPLEALVMATSIEESV